MNRRLIQPAQSAFRPARQGIRGRNRRPGCEHQRDRLGQQAASDESEDLCRGLVKPLCVVNDAHQGLLLSRLGQQGQDRQPHQEPVGTISRRQSEGNAQGVALSLGEESEPTDQRSAQLVEPREGEFHVRLDTYTANDSESGGPVHKVTQ